MTAASSLPAPAPWSTGRSCLTARLSPRQLGFVPAQVWSPTPSRAQRTVPLPLPATICLGTRDSESQGAKLTPPPFAVMLSRGARRTLLCVSADAGWHRWNFVDFVCRPDQIEVAIDFEGHTPPAAAAPHVRLHVVELPRDVAAPDFLRDTLQKLYPRPRRRAPVPDWWLRPIYCGWGDQVAASLAHEGPGPEPRALAYCTQGLYEHWLRRLDDASVPVGTVIVDAGWAQAGVWTPFPNQWPDLRGFIDRQHACGRRVLLWIPAWLQEGVPDRWCLFAGKRKLTVDPSHPGYRRFLRDQVRRLLSPGRDGFDADGFKIDQLGYTPTQCRPRGGEMFGRSFQLEQTGAIAPHGDTWGCELLHLWQKTVYDTAKDVKPDALINSSTVHPYFADTLDMVRLHDTGSSAVPVFEAMAQRAALSRISMPDKAIDTDNWIARDYRQWLNYTLTSHRLGVPCIFYAERFVLGFRQEPVAKIVPLADLKRIAKAWSRFASRDGRNPK